MIKRIWILLPLAWIYGTIAYARRWFYKQGIWKAYTSVVPTISVGNLCLGGAGKTPHVEYLIRLLSPHYQMAALSRGYKRKTQGVIIANECNDVNAELIGDEPCLYFHKYKNILVAVAEKRKRGIEILEEKYANLQSIVLDDAFQHLSVSRQCNILLTEYDRPYFADFVLPAGRLREWRCAAKDADIIIVTKCSPNLSEENAQHFAKKIRLHKRQSLFYTYFHYQDLLPFSEKAVQTTLTPETPILVLAGIARPQPMTNYLQHHYHNVRQLFFSDHRHFSQADYEKIIKTAHAIPNTVIITTEKDAMRLLANDAQKMVSLLPIFTLPVEVRFLFNKTEQFNILIYDTVAGKN